MAVTQRSGTEAEPFPPLHEYALAHACTSCGATPGTPCQAPRKQAAVRRVAEIAVRFSLDPVEQDPLRSMHAARADAGLRHWRRDVGQAPVPEERVAGRTYGTIGQPSAPRTAKPSSPNRGADLITRATTVFGRSPRGVAWPYGLATPLRRTYDSDAAYEEARVDRRGAQETITAWAEHYGLKASTSGCCPGWLQRRASRRCPGDCAYYAPPAEDAHWLDHVTFWLHGGRPAALTAAPYTVLDEDEQRLSWWTGEDQRLRTALGTGWYGSGTTQIVMWRADILKEVSAAPV